MAWITVEIDLGVHTDSVIPEHNVCECLCIQIASAAVSVTDSDGNETWVAKYPP